MHSAAPALPLEVMIDHTSTDTFDTLPPRRVCLGCDRVAQPDGSWQPDQLPPHTRSSHSLCPECSEWIGDG